MDPTDRLPTEIDAAASLAWARSVGPMLAASPIVVAGAFVLGAVEGWAWGLVLVAGWLGISVLTGRRRQSARVARANRSS